MSLRDTQGKDGDSPGVVVMPPAILLLCLVAGTLLMLIIPSPFLAAYAKLRLAAGAALSLSGFAFMMWAHGLFTRLGVNVKTVCPASQLVARGAYAYSRNPMYVGMLAMLAGIGFICGDMGMIAMCLPMFAYLSLYAIPREEAYLGRRFGTEYAAYRGKVRRWL